MNEIRELKKYKGYFLDARGNIYSIKQLKPFKKNGYSVIVLRRGGKIDGISISRETLKTFGSEPPSPHHQCSHINGKRSDNRIENLMWCTPKENTAHKIHHGTSQCGEKSGVRKLSLKDVLNIKKEYKRVGKNSNYLALAKKYKVGGTTIHAIISGRGWGLAIKESNSIFRKGEK